MTDAEMSAAGNSPGAPEPLSDPQVSELESQLAESRGEADKYRDEFLRARAEADNIRRRAQEDVAKAHRFGQENFASALLAVKDSLDAALAVDHASVDAYREGVEITARQLDAAFEKNAIKAIDPQGQKFDPHQQQAISQVESDQEAGTVVQVLQKGYLLHDRVLRPALVVVARAKDS